MQKMKMTDGCRPQVAGGTNSSIRYVSVGLNLFTKFGDPRTSSSFSAKIFFQNDVCCRKKVANDVMFCGNMCEGMPDNPIKFGEIRRNRLRERQRNAKIKMAAVLPTGSSQWRHFRLLCVGYLA